MAPYSMHSSESKDWKVSRASCSYREDCWHCDRNELTHTQAAQRHERTCFDGLCSVACVLQHSHAVMQANDLHNTKHQLVTFVSEGSLETAVSDAETFCGSLWPSCTSFSCSASSLSALQVLLTLARVLLG